MELLWVRLGLPRMKLGNWLAAFFVMPPLTSGYSAVCVCICPCVPSVVNAISYKSIGRISPNFQHWCILTRMNISSFGVKRSKFKGTFGLNMLSWKLLDWISPNVSVLMHFGTRMNASVFGAKRSKVNVTAIQHDQGPCGRRHIKIDAARWQKQNLLLLMCKQQQGRLVISCLAVHFVMYTVLICNVMTDYVACQNEFSFHGQMKNS